ncbi:WD40-repeat-containing domain protein [Gigaspora rosea]|uniref:WD40-repeat-containing domain protein n=1 Tax=Gigaspora rosea TaxID=44941 RepID=A0A397V1B7_9GLOM|nr:WD40-repeat-containing domain protein [Gigaspora rosea]
MSHHQKKKKVTDKESTSDIDNNLTFQIQENLIIKESVEDFLIVVGSYERILYGINGCWCKPSLRFDPTFIFPAHIGCIKAVAIGSRYLASGSTDEIIKLYDIKKRKEIGSLLQHDGSITTIKFYNKTHMISGSEDGTLCIWRTKDWEYLKILKGHKGRVNSVDIHPSGKIALSVSSDKTVRLWNLLTGRKAAANKLGRGEMVIWNPSGDRYAILMGQEIDGQVIQTFQLKNSRYLCMRYFAHDTLGDLLITGSEDKTVRVYNVKNGDCIATYMGHKSRIKDISIICSIPPTYSTPFSLLTSISSDGVINVWSLNDIWSNKEQTQNVIITTPLASYDTKSRLTCVALSQAFND